jgi:amino acid adenylation domain-containing protein
MQGDVTDLRVVKSKREKRTRRLSAEGAGVIPRGPHPTGVELFEKQVEIGPNRPAIRSGTDEASYDQLNRLANRIANAIIDRLGTEQEPVAVAMVDNVSLLAAMTGVMKANKILVTLSPIDPPERRDQMVRRSEAPLLITEPKWVAKAGLPEIDGIEVLSLPDLEPGLSEENPGIEIDPDSYARLLFTSGSTGEPKGVLKSHWVDALWARSEWARFTDQDRIAMLYAPSFAAAPSSITAALLNGGTLCLFDIEGMGLHRLGSWIKDEGITYIGIVPSFLRRFLESTPEGITFPSVRMVTLGGEALLKGDVDLYKRYFSDDCVLLNVMAATETDVMTRFVVDKDTVIDEPVVPIGYPDEGVELVIVADDGTIAGPGEPGMLYVESPRLAPGYWHDPENTAAAFVPDPRGGEGVAYKTGDLAMIREDGILVYLGRGDARVKVRGYGVDMTEVQRALLAMPAIKEAAVIAKDTDGDDARLVAYLVVDQDAPSFSREEIRAFLKDRLPAYAVPGMFVKLDHLPVTERGKVDTKALPDVDLIGPSHSNEPAPPRDDLETDLVQIWERVLKTRGVGVKDHFFDDLGGTSIQGLQVFAELASRMERDLAPTTLLRAPTIEQLAEEIRNGAGELSAASLVPVRTGGDKTPFFVVHGGGGGIFFVRDIANHIPPDRPVYGLQAEGFDGTPSGYRPVEEIAARYLSEIRAVQPNGPYLLGGLSFGGIVAYEMAQQLERQGENAELVAMLDTKLIWETEEEAYDPKRHAKRMKEMTLGEKTGYVLGGIWRRFYRQIRVWSVQITLRTRQRLPKSLAKFHFFPLFARAMRAYQPEPYDGEIIFISEKGQREVQEREWAPLIQGPMEMHEIPVGHFDLVVEPHVGVLAGYLVDAFDRVEVDRT